MTNQKLFGLVILLAIVSGIVTSIYRSGGIANLFQGSGINLVESSPLPMKYQVGDQVSPGIARVDVMPPAYDNQIAPDIINRAYQRYANFGVVVKDVSGYINNMRTYITTQGGIVTNVSVNQSDKYTYAYINSRIPVDKLDAAANTATQNVTKIMNQSLSTTDVTGYQQGMQDSITKTKRLLAEQQLMLSRATSEYEKSKIKLEIESLQNQLNNLQQELAGSKEQVQYANLDITAASSTKYFDGQPVGVWDEVVTKTSSLRYIFINALRLAIYIAVYAIVWLPVLVVIKWVFGKK